MKFFKRNPIVKGLILVGSTGLLFAIMACTRAEEKDDFDFNPDTSMQFDLPELDYTYDALEPFIDARTMEIHHTKHHNNYVNNLNAALKKHPELQFPLEQLLADLSLVPADIRTAVQNNGGGYYNHALYFSILKINNGQLPSGNLEAAINQDFGSFDAFKEVFSHAATTQFGSGWAWLIVTDEGLRVVATLNQDTPLDLGTPILVIDVWEHAYYLNYQNRRAEYISAFFDIINWDKVAELYDAAND